MVPSAATRRHEAMGEAELSRYPLAAIQMIGVAKVEQ